MRGLQPAPAASTARLPSVPPWAASWKPQAGTPQQAWSQGSSQPQARQLTLLAVVCSAHGGGSPDSVHQQAVSTQELKSSTDATAPLQLQLRTCQHVCRHQHNSHDAASQPASKVLPHHLTRKIVAAGCVEELNSIIQGHGSCLNSIHVAAALVKLAKLCTDWQGTSEDQCTAESSNGNSQSGQQHANMQTRQRVWHKQRRRRVQPSKDDDIVSHQHGIERSHQASGSTLPHATHVLVEELATELGRRYVQHAPHYSTARQHANVCWALGRLKQQLCVAPEEQVSSALESALLASDAQVLQTANTQELCSMSVGLTYLGHYSPQLLMRVCTHADTQLPFFKPQELSTLAWAASHAFRHHMQAQQQPSKANPPQQQVRQNGMGGTATSQQAEAGPQDLPRYCHVLSQQLLCQLVCSIGSIAQQACKDIQAFKPQELARLLWSCGNIGQLSPLVRTIFDMALPALQQHAHAGQLADVDISNSVWAYAKLHLMQEGRQLLDAVAPMLAQMPVGSDGPGMQSWGHTQPQHSAQPQQAASNVQHRGRHQRSQVLLRYGTQELCNILWACAALDYHQSGAVLASQLLLELSRRQHQMSSQSIANVAWATARLGLQHLVMERTALAHALADMQDLSQQAPQHVSNTLWACSTLPASVCSQPLTSEALSRLASAAHVHAKEGKLAPAGLAQLAWAAGWAASAPHLQQVAAVNGSRKDLRAGHSPWHTCQQSRSGSHGGSHQAQHTAQALAPLAGSITEAAARQLSALQPQELSVLAQGLSYAQRRSVDRDLFVALANAAMPHVASGRFSPGGLAGMLAAFVRAGASHPPLALAAAQSACTHVAQYSTVELANLLWALACMRAPITPLCHRAAHALLSGVLSQVPHTPEHVHMPPSKEPAAADMHNKQPPIQLLEQPRAMTAASNSRPFISSGFDDVDDEDDMLAPRSNASSLISQLGWDDDDAVPGDEPGPASHCAANTAAAYHSISGGSLEPEQSSKGMVWTVLAWAFARSNYHQHQLYNRLAAAVLNNWGPSASPQQVHDNNSSSSSSGSTDAGGHCPTAAAAAVASGAHSPAYQQVLSGLTTPCLVQLIWAFAVHNHKHTLLLHEAAAVLSARILHGSLGTREVATLAWAYAKLQQYEPQLFTAILHEAMAHGNRYGLRDWSRLVYAFSTLCLPAEEAFYPRLNQLQREHEQAVTQQARHMSLPPAPVSAHRTPFRRSTHNWGGSSRSKHASTSQPGSARSHAGSHVSRGPQARSVRSPSMNAASIDDDEQAWLGRPPQRITRDMALLSPAPTRPSPRPPQIHAATSVQQHFNVPREPAAQSEAVGFNRLMQVEGGRCAGLEASSAAHARQGVMVAAGSHGVSCAELRLHATSAVIVAERDSLPMQHHHLYVDTQLGVYDEAPHASSQQPTHGLQMNWMSSTGASCANGSPLSSSFQNLTEGYGRNREDREHVHAMQSMAREST